MNASLHRGYLGNSRVVLNNHYDAATQADIQHMAVSYESEDETMGKLHARSRRATALYSRQDILEQYCISERGMGALETDRRGFFSCLSSHQLSPCTRSSILTVCVRQKIPSDENLQDLYKRPPQYAPYPRKPRWGPPPPPEIYNYEEDLNSSYFRSQAHTDASTYQWMPSDDESVRMERPRSILDHHSHHSTPHRTKHVSFARSHTLTSFDDAVVSLGASTSNLTKSARSQERLIDTRRSLDRIIPITKQPELTENVVVMEKLIRTPMKTQATQTEACLGRKPLPPGHINLSPRTVHRVKMVSQGAQTNGIVVNGRKLMKSYSEAGSKFGPPPLQDSPLKLDSQMEHEPVHRTLSDEPPRSPFILTSPPPEAPAAPPSDSSSITRSEHDSEESESKREIFIDFKPQIPQSGKKPLTKTASEGEILSDRARLLSESAVTSVSHENILAIEEELPKYLPFFKSTPIRHEDIFKDLDDHVFSSIDESFEGNGLHPQDSIDEVFHENYIYDGKYLKVEHSSTSEDQDPRKSDGARDDECIVPSFYIMGDDKSPFASSDSLANDLRDHSDGIWNESQATVLHADSGTENGTGVSTSELTSLSATSPISVKLLTPSSRRKYLLMLQHQQRSSIDTEALEEETTDQIQISSPSSPRLKIETPSISVKMHEPSSSKHFLQVRKKQASPPYKRKTPEPPLIESPQPAVVPDLLLARTDSGKTNTDISESTTTTDDYITANSTDSSRRSTSIKGVERPRCQITAPDGSSFESASSIYSVTKGDFLSDDMVVPSFSPPPILEEAIELASTPVPEVRTGRSSPTGSSSSSGSYSLNGSCPELPHRPPVPSPKHVPSLSEDDRSAHYSSSGYYDSPIDDDPTWKPTKPEVTKWTDEEKRYKKKHYTLEVTKHQEELSSSTDKSRSSQSRSKTSPPKEAHKLTPEKPKQRRIRTRSPMQVPRKAQQLKKTSILKSPEQHDVDWDKRVIEERKPLTSDDSINNELISPKKSKKLREKGRRSPRSPNGSRTRKRSGSIEDKPTAIHSSLPRKKQLQRGITQDDSQSFHVSKSKSPLSSELSPSKQITCQEASRLKALSAESLRSVSPGSDSVFYSDPSSHAAATDHHVHCLHCGKEVDIVTTDDVEKSASQPDIVQPPAGFADSPKTKHPIVQGKLFKKFEKRYRSEDRPIDRRHYRFRAEGIRAKSEERAAKSEESKCKLRPMSRSRDTSLEGLRATDSSPSVLPGAPDDEEDLGLYNIPFLESSWIYIDDQEELQTWSRSLSAEEEQPHRRDSVSSMGSTESEHDFKKRYQAVTHRMVHRKSCLEMYKRQATKSFAPESTTGEHESIREKLEDLLKLMLVVWCWENRALKVISPTINESDKTVMVRRVSGGEFGFRIHGSKPVVVSAIEPDTPAESSGLEVGDIVLAVNGVSVLDKSHSEVVKIAHAGSDTLTLEVARTCGVLSPTTAEIHGGSPLYSGYLWKLGGYASGTPSNKWIRRWFSLKTDNCLYFYKTDMDKQPVGAMMLFNYDISRVENGEGDTPPLPFRFSLRRKGVPTLHLAGDNEQAVARWLEVLIQASNDSQITDAWLEQTRRNLSIPPTSIKKPDCFGYLVKLGTQWKPWSRRYCVLKDACLYFYQDANARSAFGVACLHGYRVQQCSSGSKKHAFEIIPADPKQKHYFFHTESEMDRKRWLAALEYSIDRWLKVG